MQRRTAAAQLARGVVPPGLHPHCRMMQEALFAVATSRQGCTRELRRCADAIKEWEDQLQHWETENDRLRDLERQLKAYRDNTTVPIEDPGAPTVEGSSSHDVRHEAG